MFNTSTKCGKAILFIYISVISIALMLLTFISHSSSLSMLKFIRRMDRNLHLSLDPVASDYYTGTNSIDNGIQFSSKDESFMRLALRQAQHAYREGEVPIGAIVVSSDGEVLAASRNRIEASNDATAHAEIDCMRKASKVVSNWRLVDCTIYSTLEPCAMCLSAMQSCRIKKVIYGASDNRLGACGSWIDLGNSKHPFHKIEISGGLLASESSMLLKRFFQSKRIERRSGECVDDITAIDAEPLTSERGSLLDLI